MNNSAKSFAILFTILVVFGFEPRAAQAGFTIFGNGLAQGCAQAARDQEKGIPATPRAIELCSTALSNESLPLHDLAGTYINRGVLYLGLTKYREAKLDFDAAVQLMPEVGEAYTNRGAALVGLALYADAISDIDRGLELKSGEPEKAYFNRGLAEEGLDDIQAAYRDYIHASELKPEWQVPRNELARFSIGTRHS